ncbi:MAG: thioesterase family protein [Myxococcota bacterium]
MEMPFRSVQRVYFDDLDALNILHNVRYLLFMERARGEFLQALGFNWKDSLDVNPDKHHVIAAHDVQYLAPVRGEVQLNVELAPVHLGRTSLVLEAAVKAFHGQVEHCRCTTRLVRLDPDTGKPCPWSPRMREAIEPLLPSV